MHFTIGCSLIYLVSVIYLGFLGDHRPLTQAAGLVLLRCPHCGGGSHCGGDFILSLPSPVTPSNG